ncbi:sulfurtransferase [Jeotgalibacillus haloalkalitolerans]|uniref:Sulfurtransferase n=1 Tax=Jeotgalibacillus haloalkalitolerans TaxID=3104292 RepID=A0ABU5KPY6_9BACL|nr:sulfurtransferase [Jeotgalibacillus sp. HH7-29]MDZ5713318.1 sulfurtransferase [Jeotgalibacillus sp. HH7-29]
MELLLIAAIVIALISIYKRYAPVNGVECVPEDQMNQSEVVVDLRPYNDSTVNRFSPFQHIPYAYLKRFYKELPKENIHVIASDHVDLKLGIRFLKSKGYMVNKMTLLQKSEAGVVKLKKCGGY